MDSIDLNPRHLPQFNTVNFLPLSEKSNHHELIAGLVEIVLVEQISPHHTIVVDRNGNRGVINLGR